MEIERKFLPVRLPEDLSSYPHKAFIQGYLSVNPVVRVRFEGGSLCHGEAGSPKEDACFLTYKGAGLLSREEYNLPLTKEAFDHLIKKADGTVIEKTRYLLPMDETGALLPAVSDPEELSRLHEKGRLVELDVFQGALSPLVMAEVEFPTEEAAKTFSVPSWLGEDVTEDPSFHNSVMSREGLPERYR